MPVLDSIGINIPMMRVVGSIKVRSIARRQKAAHPDVESGLYFDARYRIEHADLVGGAFILRVKHEFDFVRDSAINVKTHAVEKKLIGGNGRVGLRMHETCLQSGANSNGRYRSLRHQR